MQLLLKRCTKAVKCICRKVLPFVKIKKRNPSLSHQEAGFLIISLPKCIVTERRTKRVEMRRIRIGVEQAKVALSDESRLAGFCFALKIKFLFRASDVHFASVNQASKTMGYNKKDFKRYLDLSVKYGYCRIVTNKFGLKRIIANKLYDNSSYSYTTRQDELTKLSLPQLKGLLRDVVVSNNINVIEEVINTHCRAVNGNTIKSVRSAKRTESRMLKKPFDEKYTSYSYSKMMKDTNSTRWQVGRTVKRLVKSGVVRKMIQCTEVGVDACVCTNNWHYYDATGNLIIISAKYRKGELRCSNKYKVLVSQISKSNSGTNVKIINKKMKRVKNHT